MIDQIISCQSDAPFALVRSVGTQAMLILLWRARFSTLSKPIHRSIKDPGQIYMVSNAASFKSETSSGKSVTAVVQCPGCLGSRTKLRFVKDSYPIHRCHDCELFFVHPQ